MIFSRKRVNSIKYDVTVDEKEYQINIEQIKGTINATHQSGSDIAYDAMKTEYDLCIQRSEKLDNKIYILLTVCAFLFVMLSDSIKKFSDVNLPETQFKLFMFGGFVVVLTLTIVVFVVLLVSLVILLRGVDIERFNANDVLELNLVNSDKMQVITYICIRYEQCRTHNHDVIEKRYKKYNNCILLIIIEIVLLLIIAFYCNLI